MTEDGIQLNFALGDLPAPKATAKFRGGSWKERSRLNRNAKNGGANDQVSTREGREQAFRRATARREKAFDHEGPPQKRRRVDGDDNVEPKLRTERRPAKERPAHLKDATFNNKPGNREIISSLFSFNPEAKADEVVANQEEQEPAKPSNAPLPDGIDTFTSLGLAESVAAHLLTKMELKNPTAIQKGAVSQLTKEDADVFIQSETGSGKTLAYLLPIVQRLVVMAERWKHEKSDSSTQQFGRDSGLFAIVLAPTRELCKQISVVLERLLGCAHFLVAGTVIGGERKKSEKARMRKGLNILVATPGRLVDHLDNTSVLDVSKVRYLVLDEGDRLMDLGFEEDITKIIQTIDGRKRALASTSIPGLPDRRITILCSATLKSNVEKLGDISLKDAVLVKGDGETTSDAQADTAFLAPAQLKQTYITCAAKLRLVTLTALLKRTFARKGSVMKAIVFISCADSVDFHHKILTRTEADSSAASSSEKLDKEVEHLGDALAPSPVLSSPTNPLNVYKMHGSLPQQTRTAIIKSFAKSTTASLLLATDVASRGLDLPNLDLVIEYDPAFAKEDHLHRIGRTARLGRDGRAMIFLMPGTEEGYVQVLKESYKQSAETTNTNVLGTSAADILRKGFVAKSGTVGSKATGDDFETLATEFQLDVERYVLADAKIKEMAKNAFQSHVRAYATHVSEERKWFDIKELHLGHLAKAFGLRDPPGKVNVQGVRSKSRPRANEGRKRTGEEVAAIEVPKSADIDDAGDAEANAQKMRNMIRNRKRMMGAGVDEFNIG